MQGLGRMATWIARAVEAHPSNVEALLPDYDNLQLGMAELPPLIVSIRNGEKTNLDFIAGLEAGDLDAIRRVAKDWMENNMAHLKVKGKAEVALKSGVLPLGTQTVSHDLVFEGMAGSAAEPIRNANGVYKFEGSNLPEVPKYDIKKLKVHEVKDSESERGIHVDVEIVVFNEYPLSFTVPPLNFDVLVPGCTTQTENILVASATTGAIEIVPQTAIIVSAWALIHDLPVNLVSTCPDSQTSPLDSLLTSYMHGLETTVLVRGSKNPATDTPQWLTEILTSTVVPISVTGHSFENFIEDFSMRDVHFSMPNPIADPDSSAAQPRISATVRVQAVLPQEINFSIDVPHVRADSDVFVEGKKLGHLDLHKWQEANSTLMDGSNQTHPRIIIESVIRDAPLNVTDNEVLSNVVQELFFGDGKIVLDVEAKVDAELSTVLGTFVIREIPAEGKVPLKR